MDVASVRTLRDAAVAHAGVQRVRGDVFDPGAATPPGWVRVAAVPDDPAAPAPASYKRLALVAEGVAAPVGG